MATVKVGKTAKVMCGPAVGTYGPGTYTVAEMGTYTLSGFTREALDATAFQDDIKEYVFGVGDGGEITFSGFYDPTDSTGQMWLRSYCSNGSTLVSGWIKFYIDGNSYLTINGGTMLITRCDAITFEKAGIGTVEFSGRLSNSGLVLL